MSAYDGRDVEIACENLVKENLASPGSAEFPGPWGGEATNPEQQGLEWAWTSFVDSENSFGASLRMDFTCTVQEDGDMSIDFF